MPTGTLDFLEEPIRAESPEAYEQLRRLIDVPLAIGEEFSSKWAFAPFIERGLTEFVRVDICNVGGFTEAIKVAAMAEAHYLDLMPHHPLDPSVAPPPRTCASPSPNVALMEFRTLAHGGPGLLRRAHVPGPGAPGGSEAVRPGPARPGRRGRRGGGHVRAPMWQPPQLHREDGSVQDW